MNYQDFIKFLQNISLQPVSVLDVTIPKNKYVPLDLSLSNTHMSKIDVSSSFLLETYINNFIKDNKALVAFGGYLEERNIYKRSSHFNNKKTEERNIHLGIDFWCSAETSVFSPFDATVHSFKNNSNYGDYGPTVILKHTINNTVFYSLFGHLSLSSITNIKVNQEFKKGEKIATLGTSEINGDYPPHLHFQLIKEIENFQGDYPGVCSKNDLEFYKHNCPNPNMILKLKT